MLSSSKRLQPKDYDTVENIMDVKEHYIFHMQYGFYYHTAGICGTGSPSLWANDSSYQILHHPGPPKVDGNGHDVQDGELYSFLSTLSQVHE